MLKIRLSFRVMIWQPFAFYILPFYVNPSKLPFHPPIRKLLILKLTSSFFFFMKIRTTLHNISENYKQTGNKKLIVSRQPVLQKTNYLKTNLLKQIKKISVFLIFQYLLAKWMQFPFHGAKVLSF